MKCNSGDKSAPKTAVKSAAQAIKETNDRMPPLTTEQRERLGVLLRSRHA